MANINNYKICTPAGGRNTRVGSCWNDIGVPRGFLIGPVGVNYTSVTVTALLAAINTNLLNDNPALRIYPVQNVVVPTDQTPDPNQITFAGNGQIVIASENARSMSFQYYQGGYCLHRSLRGFNGQQLGIMIIDSKGQLVCTNGSAADTVQFISAYFWEKQLKWAMTTSEVTAYSAFASFDTAQIDDNGVIIDCSANGGLAALEQLTGLFNVALTSNNAQTSTTATVGAKIVGCGSADMYALYKAALAVPGAWVVKNNATGGLLTVSGVASSDAFDGWVLTITAVTGLTANISLAGPTELAALGSPVVGYESNTLQLIFP